MRSDRITSLRCGVGSEDAESKGLMMLFYVSIQFLAVSGTVVSEEDLRSRSR